MSGWISCEHELPKNGQQVLFVSEGWLGEQLIEVGQYDDRIGSAPWFATRYYGKEALPTIHVKWWMAIPATPDGNSKTMF